MKMRLRLNDCKNRGFILDGVPECHTEALQLFMDFPHKRKPKKKAVKAKEELKEGGGEEEKGKEEGKEAGEEAGEEEAASMS